PIVGMNKSCCGKAEEHERGHDLEHEVPAGAYHFEKSRTFCHLRMELVLATQQLCKWCDSTDARQPEHIEEVSRVELCRANRRIAERLDSPLGELSRPYLLRVGRAETDR